MNNKKHSNKTVLLAEDDELFLHAYRAVLEHEGYEVLHAVDGVEALAMMKKEKPDLLLLDLMMPKKNGFELLDDMQKDNAVKDIPVIVISNLAQGPDIERVKAMGVQDYLVKTDFSVKGILVAIAKAVK